MHSIARENLQSFLYSYKETPREVGIPVVFDSRQIQTQKKFEDEHRALRYLVRAADKKVAFAVKTNISYDGSLENESPFYRKTVSFQKNQFLHIYMRYSKDWWIGRTVALATTIGFIPTARRLSRLLQTRDETPQNTPKKRLVVKQSELYEWPAPYTVVPSTRPILLLGPSFQKSRLTELMHAAVSYLPTWVKWEGNRKIPEFAYPATRVTEYGHWSTHWKVFTIQRSAIVKHFGSRIRRLETDIGNKDSLSQEYDVNERELRVITALSEELHLVLLETPHLNVPSDTHKLNLAPLIFLFRINNRKILIKLLKKAGIKGGSDLANADTLLAVDPSQVDVVVEEKDLGQVTRHICSFLEDYWTALHPTTPLLEQSIRDLLPPDRTRRLSKAERRRQSVRWQSFDT